MDDQSRRKRAADSQGNDDKTKRKRKIKSQDEKAKNKKEKEREMEMGRFRSFLMKARQSVNFWSSKFCGDLREFCRFVQSHPSQFPMAANDSPLVDGAPILASEPKLSIGFVDEVAQRSDDVPKDPILRVLACSIGFEDSGYNSTHQKARKARLILGDGSAKKCMGVVVSNLLPAVQEQFTRHGGQPIIRLKKFNTTEYSDVPRDGSDTPQSRPKPGILIVQYEFLCRPIQDISLSEFAQAFMKDEEEEQEDRRTESEAVLGLDNPTTALHHRIIEFQKRADVRRLPAESCSTFCKPENRLCSYQRQKFVYCLAEKYEREVQSLEFLESISQQCYFVDREVSDMTASQKRNVLYYWFATNLYMVKGAGNRKKLPDCLVCLIRMSYPNKPEEPYKEFESRGGRH